MKSGNKAIIEIIKARCGFINKQKQITLSLHDIHENLNTYFVCLIQFYSNCEMVRVVTLDVVSNDGGIAAEIRTLLCWLVNF